MATKKGQTLTAIVDIAGNIDPSLSKAINSAVSNLDKIDKKSLITKAAIAGIAVITAKMAIDAGKYLLNLGTEFDKVSDTIRIGTGATGEALAALNEDFNEVYKSVPTTMEDASKAIADYNTRLGLTGEDLQALSKQAIQASSMLGEDLGSVIEESSQAFQQWNIATDDMADAMDYVFKVSQSTGMGFNSLMTNTQKYGAQMQELGYSFESATALMGQMDKAGVNTEEVLAAMKKSVASLAKEGVSASDGIAMYYEAIQNAGSEAEAATIAGKIFGAKAGTTMAIAIRKGTLAVGALTAELKGSDESISKAAEDTYDFAERLQIFKQKAAVALRPMSGMIFDAMDKIMPQVISTMEILIPILVTLGERVIPIVASTLTTTVGVLAGFVNWIDKTDGALGFIALTIGTVVTILKVYKIAQAAAAAATTIWGIVAGGATAITTALGVAFAFLTSPIGIIVLAIAAVIAIGVLLYKNWDKVTAFLFSTGDKIMEFFGKVATFMGNILKAPLNSLISGVNTVIGGLNKMTIPDWVPGIGGKGINIPLIPKLAAGGFTKGISIAGEAGQEAVLSFDPAYRRQNLSYWAQAGERLGVADENELGLLTGGSSSNTVFDLSGLVFSPQIAVNGQDPEDIIQKLKDYEPDFIDFILEALARWRDGEYDPKPI